MSKGALFFINSGGRSSGIFNVYYDSSIATYGYTSHFNSAYTSWNGISSKVKLTKTTSTTNYPDKYYVGTTATPGTYGWTTYWYKNIFGNIVEVT